GHQGSVGDVVVSISDEPPASEIPPARSDVPWLIIRPVAVDSDIDLDLEIYSAQERSGLLAEALDLHVAVVDRASAGSSAGTIAAD
ncbi:MAG: hypothetical protein OEW83_17100, partial [Acidimicrobiia bacterium]|nr:hypothetical protein [Acidimicrobiia bacterium]